MTAQVRLACEPNIVFIPLDRILPTKKILPGTKGTSKFKCIAASILELGLIEPLVVHSDGKRTARYVLLDGHVRLEVLKDLGQPGAKCLVATDDEAFTYNHKVNRLSAIQEHLMILRAIRNGVDEERIARTLSVDVSSIRQKRDLLEGICPEAVALLRDKDVTTGALREFRKVKPMRQIEMAELICASHNFSAGYAKCLVVGTPQEQMADPDRPKEIRGLTAEEISRMEHEMETLGKDFKVMEETHGRNTLNLVVVTGYLKSLMNNARVVRYLSQRHYEVMLEFQKIVEARVLSDPSPDTETLRA